MLHRNTPWARIRDTNSWERRDSTSIDFQMLPDWFSSAFFSKTKPLMFVIPYFRFISSHSISLTPFVPRILGNSVFYFVNKHRYVNQEDKSDFGKHDEQRRSKSNINRLNGHGAWKITRTIHSRIDSWCTEDVLFFPGRTLQGRHVLINWLLVCVVFHSISQSCSPSIPPYFLSNQLHRAILHREVSFVNDSVYRDKIRPTLTTLETASELVQSVFSCLRVHNEPSIWNSINQRWTNPSQLKRSARSLSNFIAEQLSGTLAYEGNK